MKDRNRAWRRRQARRVLAKVEETKAWLLKTIQKRTGDRPMPVPGAKNHDHGKLTKAQHLRLETSLRLEVIDALAA